MTANYICTRTIKEIILHCSVSNWGSVEAITHWHTDPPPRGRGWDGIGYHYVVLNGYIHSAELKKPPIIDFSEINLVKTCRDLSEIGNHAKGHNECSIGVVMIGEHIFPPAQVRATVMLIQTLMARFPSAKVIGHYEINDKKTCPNLDMDYFRSLLA